MFGGRIGSNECDILRAAVVLQRAVVVVERNHCLAVLYADDVVIYSLGDEVARDEEDRLLYRL